MKIHPYKLELEKNGWLYDEFETSCEAYVKGIYDLWFYPIDKRIIIESEEYGIQVNEIVKNSNHLLKIIQPFTKNKIQSV